MDNGVVTDGIIGVGSEMVDSEMVRFGDGGTKHGIALGGSSFGPNESSSQEDPPSEKIDPTSD